MKKTTLLILIILSIILLTILSLKYISNPLTRNTIKENTISNQTQNTVCFKEKCISLEIAQTPQQRARGLMFRKNLDENQGMLFIFENSAFHSFWMKNTLIPLDIIWINENKEIVYLISANPCKTETCESYKPDSPAKYVLEVNQGFVRENNIKVGDKIKINFLINSKNINNLQTI